MPLFDDFFVVSGALGAAGALAIIGVHLGAPSTRCQSRQLLFWLSVADLLQSLFFCVYLGEWLRAPATCLVHSALGIVGASSSFLWTACMAYEVNFSVHHPGATLSRGTLLAFHLLCWGYPLVTAGLMLRHAELRFQYPVAQGQLGWFACFEPVPLWTAIQFELPLLGCWLFTLAMYLKARRDLPLQEPLLGGPAVAELRAKFLLVPLLFLALRVWAFADLLLLLTFPQYRTPLWVEVVMHLRGLCDPLQGFCNAVVFVGMNPVVWPRARSELFGPTPPRRYGALRGPGICGADGGAAYQTFPPLHGAVLD